MADQKGPRDKNGHEQAMPYKKRKWPQLDIVGEEEFEYTSDEESFECSSDEDTEYTSNGEYSEYNSDEESEYTSDE